MESHVISIPFASSRFQGYWLAGNSSRKPTMRSPGCQGIVGFLMKVKSSYSVLDALQNLHRLDVSYWNALVSAGWPGLEIIAAPSDYLPKDPVPGESLAKVVAFVRAHYAWTVVDLGCTLNLSTIAVLDEIDEI